MNSNYKLFSKISNLSLFTLILILSFFKIIIYILIKNQVFEIPLGGGNDSIYYDEYARGYINIAVNIWPVILRYLNEYNLYSRNNISYLFLYFNLFLIPIIVCKLADLNFKKQQKYYLYLFLICVIYPTMYFYTLDIYRDLFMVLVFLIGCLFVRASIEKSSLLQYLFLSIISLLIGIFLVMLRPYLGYAFLLSLILWKIRFNKKRIIFLGVLYFLTLFVASYIGVLESITEYREIFEELGGGSTLGLDFSNPMMFIPNFILSILGQLFGLYITNPLAVIILLIETVPFTFMLGYVIKNIKLADSFSRFLIIFFVLYASVWLIGNDNLGTALRLRMYNYLAIYICFFHIVKAKTLSKSNELRSSYL